MSIWFGNLFIHDNHVFICYSTTVEEQVAYGGKVVGESAMVNAEDIGNEVIHKYFVSTVICFKTDHAHDPSWECLLWYD